PASACLMNPMICSVVKRLFFMSVLVVDGLYSFTWYGSAGAGHDNGKEFCGKAMVAWAHARNVQLRLIQPGKPNQNAYVESFNGRLRDECLNEHWFPTLLHARTEIERWRREYNEDRPKKAIGGMTPAAYAQHLANTDIINPGL
ncbi:integrase core domain-containing protein, partial [Xanthomonas campestris]|uniref:integrase core domain-containing protein n=1 Tax=Xanthomonas campestris TaxID=339 RepID=UPI0039C12114